MLQEQIHTAKNISCLIGTLVCLQVTLLSCLVDTELSFLDYIRGG